MISAQAEATEATVMQEDVRRIVARGRESQAVWQESSLKERLRVVRRFRDLLVTQVNSLVDAIQLPQRPMRAESLAMEIIPLADACRFLERRAASILAPQIGSRGDRPAWGRGLRVQTWHEPLGIVLVIGTWNYPLLLTGVQTLQAVVAGNAVLIKPGDGCSAVMRRMVELLQKAGVPRDLVQQLPEPASAAQFAIATGVDKVVFTGSAATGRKIMSQLAEHGTPSVMELSGCDAAFVLPQADLQRAAKCLAYGLRANGSSTCIAPRRVFVPQTDLPALRRLLEPLVDALPATAVHPRAFEAASQFIQRVLASNCVRAIMPAGLNAETCSQIIGDATHEQFPFVLLVCDPSAIDASSSFQLSQAVCDDIFAPVMTLIPVDNSQRALTLDRQCGYALGASVFGPVEVAEKFSRQVDAGCVVVNDMIAPTADPRVAFGGRRKSGFGVTRGAAGLLEMTQIKTVIVQRSSWLPHLDPPQPELGGVLRGFLAMQHAASWRVRWSGFLRLVRAGRALWNKQKSMRSK